MGLTRSLRSLHPPGVWIANRIEVRFTALGYFALEGTDQRGHREQASMIRHYIGWRNRHITDRRLRKVIRGARRPPRSSAPLEDLQLS